MKKISLPTLAEVKARKVNLAQLEAYAVFRKTRASKLPIHEEHHQAMHEFTAKFKKRFQVAMRPARKLLEQKKVHLDAIFEFMSILEGALQNSVIIQSDKISSIVKSLKQMWGKTDLSNFDRIEEALKPLIEREKSKQAAAASRASHQLRASAKDQTLRCFMAKKGQWNSISHAVEDIEKEIPMKIPMGGSEKDHRKMATNIDRNRREWISAYIHADKSAFEKLTPNAQRRLKKAPR